MSVFTPIDAPTEYYSANLITLEELKFLLQIDASDTTEDDFLEASIAGASAAIVKYTERDFGTEVVTEEREFQYDGSGVLDIDDCTDVTLVKFSASPAPDLEIPADSWSSQPPLRADSPVHYYLLVPTFGGWPAVSPMMGFTSNLDRYFTDFRGRSRLPQIVKVTADWGWPNVPADVKQAVAWTIDEWRSRAGDGDSLTAHTIEGFSESWQRGGSGPSVALAIPSRARDILSAYERHQV